MAISDALPFEAVTPIDLVFNHKVYDVPTTKFQHNPVIHS